MLRSFIIILLTVLLSNACSFGPKKHKEPGKAAVSKEQVATADYNRIGKYLQEFLSNNSKPLKGWPFKKWGWTIVGNRMVFKMPKGEIFSGVVLIEFLNLEQVNHYDARSDYGRDELEETQITPNEVYTYCGTLDVSDSLNCYIYTVVNEKRVGYHDAFALIVKDRSVTGCVKLACEGYGLWNSISTNRISRNTFVMASFAVDMIDENGNSPGCYYAIRINDDGSITRFDALESDFNKPTWK
ncbi:MAG: hypothetical protein IJ222_06310 [Bacteroidales bacterium]|nr:hypothetical protein [Bacteroidales bacterium]